MQWWRNGAVLVHRARFFDGYQPPSRCHYVVKAETRSWWLNFKETVPQLVFLFDSIGNSVSGGSKYLYQNFEFVPIVFVHSVAAGVT